MSEALGSAPVFSPTQFIGALNQTLDYAYNPALIEGEVANFKTSQGKWVFFDLKDETSSVSCFIPLWELRIALEDGMKIRVRAVPKVTKWGKFSLTVKTIRPAGEGDLKRAFELLKQKLEKEGLFAPEKKRPLPENLHNIGVISSTESAGYSDFVKILNNRWGGYHLKVAHTQVQGEAAPDQIISALNYFNEHADVQLIIIIRGGGSADDLSCFNDEKLVRAIAASKIPVLTGIGHERDTSLSDLAADLRASTPSNAAEMISPDKTAEQNRLKTQISALESTLMTKINAVYFKTAVTAQIHDFLIGQIGTLSSKLPKMSTLENHLYREISLRSAQVPSVSRLKSQLLTALDSARAEIPSLKRLQAQIVASVEAIRVKIPPVEQLKGQIFRVADSTYLSVIESATRLSEDLENRLTHAAETISHKIELLLAMNPEKVLRQGYAIISGNLSPGAVVKITTAEAIAEAEVKKVTSRK